MFDEASRGRKKRHAFRNSVLTDPITLRNATYSDDRRPLGLSDYQLFANIATLIEKQIDVDRLARHVLLECDKFSAD